MWPLEFTLLSNSDEILAKEDAINARNVKKRSSQWGSTAISSVTEIHCLFILHDFLAWMELHGVRVGRVLCLNEEQPSTHPKEGYK